MNEVLQVVVALLAFIGGLAVIIATWAVLHDAVKQKILKTVWDGFRGSYTITQEAEHRSKLDLIHHQIRGLQKSVFLLENPRPKDFTNGT